MTLRERLQEAGATPSLPTVLATAEAVAAQFRLPFNRQSWRGQAGNWAGAGIGSSIDFQDHRPYVPGDDPRYINWQAYARSGHYTMKLYREEVRPQVDLLLDVSHSMFVDPEKAIRMLELFYFVCHSARRSGALLNATATSGGTATRLQPESLSGADWELPEAGAQAQTPTAPDLRRIHFGAQSMRVVISDFLFELDPAQWLAELARGGSQMLLFCVYTDAEMRPNWLGDTQLLDCESGKRAHHHFTREELERYHQRYDAHFALWEQQATRYRARFCRMGSTTPLAQQLLAIAGPHGGVELCN